MLAPIAKASMLFNMDRFFNNFNLLNNPAVVLDECKNATAIRAGIKGMRLKIINFFDRKRLSFVLSMSGLAANITGRVAFFLSRRFDNIRRWRLRGVGRILREFSDLVSQFSIDFNSMLGEFPVACGEELNLIH